MSLMKRCRDLLESGSTEERYVAASFVIKSEMSRFGHLPLKDLREMYEKKISRFCRMHDLKKRPLGRLIATRELSEW